MIRLLLVCFSACVWIGCSVEEPADPETSSHDVPEVFEAPPDVPPLSTRDLRLRASECTRRGDHGGAAEAYAELATRLEPSAELQMQLGTSMFFAGRVRESVDAFDAAIALEPPSAPYNWQRGISLYYAGRFRAGREQFEVHRNVNPHDVENAAWHYLCHAREVDPATAAKHLIPIETDRDTRVPMAEVYRLFAGAGSVEQVMEAAKADGRQQAWNYATLYLGLWHEAHGREVEAAQFIEKAAVEHFLPNYMGQVSRVHWERIQSDG